MSIEDIFNNETPSNGVLVVHACGDWGAGITGFIQCVEGSQALMEGIQKFHREISREYFEIESARWIYCSSYTDWFIVVYEGQGSADFQEWYVNDERLDTRPLPGNEGIAPVRWEIMPAHPSIEDRIQALPLAKVPISKATDWITLQCSDY